MTEDRNGHTGHDDAGGDRRTARNDMVDDLGDRVERPSTEAALRSVPRHAFVPDARVAEAYADRPLPIGGEQTISAPHMVAEMTDRLALAPGDRVLEIGTGCGYHAAVTAEIVGPENVFSVEYDADLAGAARERLSSIGYGAVSIRAGDGWTGWYDHAPYDAAYLTCAAARFPRAVVEQVRAGGRLLGPIGNGTQRLVALEKGPNGLDRETLTRVRFVPMRGGE